MRRGWRPACRSLPCCQSSSPPLIRLIGPTRPLDLGSCAAGSGGNCGGLVAAYATHLKVAGAEYCQRLNGYSDERSGKEIEADQRRDRRLGGRYRHGDPCTGDVAVEIV